jgi:hypothetical protein
MQAVTGIFLTQSDAERAVGTLSAAGVPADCITLFTPGRIEQKLKSVPVEQTEQPGMGKAVGAVLGAAGGISAGTLLTAVLVPGVGAVTAAGLVGGAILGAAGAAAGAKAGGSIENTHTHGLPADELFVYEDALRKGRCVVVALAADAEKAEGLRKVFQSERAEEVDAARQHCWIGLRSAEQEHYTSTGASFSEQDEKFYRLGFEDALHARNRCKEFDQVSAEMTSRLEELQREYPGAKIEEPYTRGYQRDREYYQQLCDQQKAA